MFHLIPILVIIYFRLSGAASQCGTRPLENTLSRVPLIVNGRTARYGEIPWQVGLFYSGQYYCGGALIDKKFVLTAGHCADSASDIGNLKLRMGEYDLHSDLPKAHTERGVVKKIIHESFVRFPTPVFDIALLELDSEVPSEDNIQPICLLSGTDTLEGQTATIGGWGHNSSNGVIMNLLQIVDLPVISNTQCQQWVSKKSRTTIRSDWLCAGYEMGVKDACTGDSGGPLWKQLPDGKFYVIGVTSAGFDCAQAYLPGVYTRVNVYNNWITQKIQEATNAIRMQRILNIFPQSVAQG